MNLQRHSRVPGDVALRELLLVLAAIVAAAAACGRDPSVLSFGLAAQEAVAIRFVAE